MSHREAPVPAKSGSQPLALFEPYLLFSCAGEPCALAASGTDQVVQLAATVPVPLAPDIIVGLQTLHGRLITVVDFVRLLGLGTAKGSQVILLGTPTRHLGLLVDSVDTVVKRADLTLLPAADLGFADAIMTWRDRAVAVFEPEAVRRRILVHFAKRSDAA